MLRKMIHVNSKGEVLDFIALGIYLKSNDLINFEWKYTMKSGKVSRFYRDFIDKDIQFTFNLKDRNRANEIKDDFYEHFEVDVITQQQGYFEINGYKFYCYIIGNKKEDYSIHNYYLKTKLTVLAEDPAWKKETTVSFNRKQTESETSSGSTSGLKFPFNYPYNFGKNSSVKTLDNDDFVSTEFKLIIYGSCTNPFIKIGDNTYHISVSLEEGDYLLIDSKDKNVEIVRSNGKREKAFKYRDKDFYIFEKIPSGSNTVAWDSTFGFDVILVEERSEPKWT